jgi:formate-dependent nitrite reductase cytochrome c552 subunit
MRNLTAVVSQCPSSLSVKSSLSDRMLFRSRSVFVGAENSVGFHNPTEAMRILGDSTAFALKAEGLLRQALTKARVSVPVKVDLELHKYLDNRGEKN